MITAAVRPSPLGAPVTKRLLAAALMAGTAFSFVSAASATHACYPLFAETQWICEDVPHRVQDALCYKFC